jgi:N utilization substance protein B
MTLRSRERARGLLVKALYQWQLTGHELPTLLEQYSGRAEFGRIDQEYFEDLLGRVIADTADLDALIARFADRGIDQLDAVGRSILLLALAELKYREDVPVKVVINEAVKLAKRYGASESFRFVNAVADKAARTLRAGSEVTAG